jgi:hypothetical protein
VRMRVRRRRFTKQSDSHPRCATCSRAGQLVRRRCPVACCPRPARIRCVPKNACACSLSAPVLLALVQRRTRGPFLNGSSQRRLPRVFAYPALLLTRKRRHDKHRAGCMSHRAFSDTANERSPQTSSTMRRDNDQIGRLQLAIYFCLHRGKCAGKGGKMASIASAVPKSGRRSLSRREIFLVTACRNYRVTALSRLWKRPP